MSRLYVLLILFTSCSVAVANDHFDELDNEMARFESEKPDSSEMRDEFQYYVQSQQSDYQVWQQQYLQAFDQFQQSVIEKWGKSELSEAEYDIEFSEDKNSKTVIDYQNEQVKVELIVDKNLSQQDAQKAIQLQLEKLLADKESNIAQIFNDNKISNKGDFSISDIEFSEANKQQSKEIIVKQTQALAQEIDKKTDSVLLADSSLTEKEASVLATQEKMELLKSSQARLEQSDKNYSIAQSNAKKETKIVSYTVKLPKNSLHKRASKYAGFAEKESAKNHIPAPLIMAIMHSESAFNPRAKSPVPAYGLMQIVPRTAGHDVNKLVRNIDKPMDPEDLYVPEINVETGSAYLNILGKRYLKSIKDDQSRLYCTIAAYNTGAGNVARVFNKDGSRNINKAAKVINQLTADQVYQQLLARLPYDETKHYLERVNTRIALYQ
ncbi:transglycosylase SLT domain-containing protein [Psychromonas sp. Urea-02u-13]|uniref:transglycosylase SLT domain-containing protein n=1 Tax=Psychromonas sp. Urea-02u-13 TaxID=2058326 RepID=UPI000C343D45|nr:transglycosylase SLT domain-containing protein [Psychromonas sp. Urea-02u-13]PKG40331.1 murein transglycosylase [Psychromonas sp. Urea-02u-13]